MADVIPIVLRYDEANLGIRAHPEMTYGKCWKSLLMPWHNEWVNIWLYILFSIYFWVQLFLIALEDHK